MSFTTTNLSPRVGTEISTDKKTLLSGGTVASEIRRLLEQRGVLIARGVGFDDAEQVAFAKTLGTVRLGNVKSEGIDGVMKITFDKKENPTYGDYARGHYRGTFYWHMDGTYDKVPPLATILTPRILAPTGGETEFTNTYAAYEQLPEPEKVYLESLKVLHSVESVHRLYNLNPDAETLAWWATFPTRVRSMVWSHQSGRKSLLLGASCNHIIGLDRKDSDATLQRLLLWATQPQFVYKHQWQLGDVLIWDNTGSLHRVLPFDVECGRRLHRVTLEGEESLAEIA